MMGIGSGISLPGHFSALQDPRQAWKVLSPLPEILLLVLAATLAGADDLVEARLWGRQHLAFLRRFLPYRHGIPSHDTLGDVVNALDPARFKRCFVARRRRWRRSLREWSRFAAGSRRCARPSPTSSPSTARPRAAAMPRPRAARRCTSSPPLRRLGAGCAAVGSAKGRWASRQRLVLGQEAVAGTSHEITAIPRLLERLQLAGALVTIDRSAIDPVAKRAAPSGAAGDAIGCQTKIARASLAKAPTICWR